MKLDEVVYHRPDISAFQDEVMGSIKKLKSIEDYTEFRTEFLRIAEKTKSIYGAVTVVSVRYSQNTKDEFYEKEQTYFDEVSPQLQKLSTDFTNSLLDSKFRPELEKEFGKQYFELAELNRKSINEEVMPMLQKENLLSSEYQKIVSQILIEFEGKKYNTSSMKPFLEHPDREKRKKACKALFETMMNYQKEFDSIYDQLVKIRHEIALKLGFSNFIELGYIRMGRTAYGPHEVQNYRNYIAQYVTPKANELKDRIRMRLGLDKIYHYDPVLFIDGNAIPQASPEEMIASAQKMYSEMSVESGEFFQSMQEKGMLDLLSRDNKSPGGYCTYVDAVKSPFIFSNFNGTSGDVDVLTHEAGHAFQCYCSMHFPLAEYYFPTSESAEIHSMAMEFFAEKWMDAFFKEDTKKYKLEHLMEAFLFLPYGAAVDEFQHEVYTYPDMTPVDRRNLWLRIQEKYTPWVQYDDEPYLESGSRWQNQSHIFQMPFYYIDYTLAQISAFEFYKKMQEDYTAAWKDYYALCCEGGSKNFLELLSVGSLSSPFVEKSFAETINYIVSRIQILEEDFYRAKTSTG